jgi:hypothetical protein
MSDASGAQSGLECRRQECGGNASERVREGSTEESNSRKKRGRRGGRMSGEEENPKARRVEGKSEGQKKNTHHHSA